ncbi:hypothetical protein [Acrocarpospora pleiomorpha]|uniref:hypothetical protein n=1 Tax=Acrocarpospora pleiomorpha TaxID=90975 RepID=UPI0012D31B38|nr:hypothetical protein [Acrocarpospora pleiomorpha]
MPTTIALVVMGRCRPSPDRMPEGASSDAASCRVVVRRGAAMGFCQCCATHCVV